MKNKTHYLAMLPLAASILLASCGDKTTTESTVAANDSSAAVEQSATTERSAEAIRKSAYDVATRSANWQISQMDSLDYIPESHRAKSLDPKFWIQAALYIGMTRWVDQSNDQALFENMKSVAESVDYELLQARPYHADDHTIGQTYIWLSEKTGNKHAYASTQKMFDMILANKPNVGLEMIEEQESNSKHHLEGNCQLRWCWADALFMAPRTWLKLSNITGDPKYFEYADKEFWAAADYLFSDKYGLFFRDSRYFEKKSPNGKPVFWGRGNGWVFAAIPLIIDDLPEGHPSRERYIELYKKNAAGLMKLQRENGFWPASLMDPEIVKTPEVSGTGFITFGLAWGVNNGILTDPKAIDIVENGWKAIESAVSENGRVNWVQHVGKSPDPVKETDSQLYGTGAVLLSASEMAKWQH